MRASRTLKLITAKGKLEFPCVEFALLYDTAFVYLAEFTPMNLWLIAEVAQNSFLLQYQAIYLVLQSIDDECQHLFTAFRCPLRKEDRIHPVYNKRT